MKNALPVLFLYINFFLIIPTVLAEPVKLCPYQKLSVKSGTYAFCNFPSRPGEQIITEVFYKPGSNGVATGEHSARFWHSGSLDDGGWPGASKTLSLGQYYYFHRDVTPLQAGYTWLRYSVTGATTNQPDLVSLQVTADRSNLKALPVYFELDGKLQTPFEITTQTPFRKGDVLVSLSVKALPVKANIIEFPIERGVDLSMTTVTNTQLFTRRTPIPRGTSELIVTVNPEETFAEVTMDDNVYIKDISGSTLPVEKVPDIMGAAPNNWELAKDFLNMWIDTNAARNQKNPEESSIDWNLEVRQRPDISWLLDINNAPDSRIINKFNEFVQPNETGFLTPKGKEEIAKKVKAKFMANPSATTVDLSTPYGSGISEEDYHEQQTNYATVEEPSMTTIDAAWAAFGNFSFYAVPVGTATKEVKTIDGKQVVQYFIKIKKVAIHVADSFDFNGQQWLGCFESPNYVSAMPNPLHWNANCFWNADFRGYRTLTARGADYNIFTIPYTVTFPQSRAFWVS